MKYHKALMVALVAVALLLLVAGPSLGIGAGVGLLFLLCPLMMLGMMFFMGRNHDGTDHEK